MLGSLIPCDGGPPIGLTKPKLKLRLRSRSENPSATDEAYAELLLTDGLWTVCTSGEGLCVQINDAPCARGRLMPDDVLTVGRHRYRINYRPPQADAPPAAPPKAPPPPAPVRPAPPTEAPVLGLLIPCAGGRAVMLRKPNVILGRAADCDVVVALRSVSGRHCELNFIDGHWQLNDLDSRNGTFVDGMAYQMKWLFPGNVLGISTQRFRLEYVPSGERPSTAADDIPVLSRKSLMASVGLTEKKLDSLVPDKDSEEPSRRRWRIDE